MHLLLGAGTTSRFRRTGNDGSDVRVVTVLAKAEFATCYEAGRHRKPLPPAFIWGRPIVSGPYFLPRCSLWVNISSISPRSSLFVVTTTLTTLPNEEDSCCNQLSSVALHFGLWASSSNHPGIRKTPRKGVQPRTHSFTHFRPTACPLT